MGESLMSSSNGKGVEISIWRGQQSQKIRIDTTNGSSHTTLRKIDFIPKDSKNFKLALPKTGLMPTVGKRWGDFADGIGKDGAIITFSEHGGKKLRHNDTITTQIPFSTKIPLPNLPKRMLEHFKQISVDNTPIEQW